MEEVSVIGIDLAKRSLQVHGAKADGSVAFRRKLGRGRLLRFLASQPGCTVAMEACASAHREIAPHGHEVRLVPPIYGKPFVKRSMNDAADDGRPLRRFRDRLRPRLQTRRQWWRSPSWERTQGLATACPYRSPTGSSAPASACVFVQQRASATSFTKNSVALIERLAGTPGRRPRCRKPPSANVNGCTHRFLPNP